MAVTGYLSGCAQGVYHVEINQDGSVDARIAVGLDEEVRDLTSGWDPLDALRSKLKQGGFEIDDYQNGGYTGVMASKHYRSIEQVTDDLQDSRATMTDQAQGKEGRDGNGLSFDYKADESFFYTTYKVKGRVDVPLLLEGHFGAASDGLGGFVENIGDWILGQLNLQAKLTLPHRFELKHNATTVEDDGKTLVWVFDPAEENRIELEFTVPHVQNILVAAIGGFAAVALILVMVIRSRKR